MVERKLLTREALFPIIKKKKRVKPKGKREFPDPYSWCQTKGGHNPKVIIKSEWKDGKIKFTEITVGD